MDKLKILGEAAWDERAKEASTIQPIKGLTNLPNMVGITEDAARYLKWKSLKWIIQHDKERKILKGFLKHPFKYAWNFIKSTLKNKPYLRQGDFFLYGIQSIDEFKKKLENKESILVVGFSYCHKPFECPSGRFTPNCVRDENNLVCQQCFIGKTLHFLPQKNTIPLFIPTIHYVGEKIFDIVHAHPNREILFIITACEMTLEMFGDLGNMVEIKGMGIRLDGRICNTMKAFELSEQGIKPGLTVVLKDTQQEMLQLAQHRKNSVEG